MCSCLLACCLLFLDLGIVSDPELGELLRKGPKYRERRAVDWEIVVKGVEETVDSVVLQWAAREGAEGVALAAWKK